MAQRSILGCIAVAIVFTLLFMLHPSPGHAGVSSCNQLSDRDFTAAVLDKAISHVADTMTDGAGRRALLWIYQNARQNHPRFPLGIKSPFFTSRAESVSLSNIGIFQTLKHLTTIRDAVIAPAEALVAGDKAGAWSAFSNFASDKALSGVLGLAFSPGPAAIISAALKVYKESVETLQQETCLLNIDLEYYALTMSDPRMRTMKGKERVSYYINNYLVGAGKAPDKLDRAIHRERAQCYLEQHLSSDLINTEISSGRSDPFGIFVDAVSGIGYKNNAYRTAIQSMLSHFDKLQSLEASRRSLVNLRRDSGYRAIKAATESISQHEGEDLIGRICVAVSELQQEKDKMAAGNDGYIGCYRDTGHPDPRVDKSKRDLNKVWKIDEKMTVQKCIQMCGGYRYAAVQYGKHCFCDNSYGKYGKVGNCNMPCAGDVDEICGGSWANSVYSTAQP